MTSVLASWLLAGIYLLITVISCIVLLGSLHQVREQARKLSTYPSVPALIRSSVILAHDSVRRTTYSPEIAFTYQFAGRQEYAATPLMFTRYASWAWATELVDRFPPGTHCTAYHAPTDANDAYLVHEADFTPYLDALLAMLCIGFVLVVSVGRSTSTTLRTLGLVFYTLASDAIASVAFSHYLLLHGAWTTRVLVSLMVTAMFCGFLTLLCVSRWSGLRLVSGSVSAHRE